MPTAVLLISLLASPPAGDPAKPDMIAPGIRESQVMLQIDHDGKRTQLQATVVSREGDVVTVLTAGHGVGSAHEGTKIRLRRGDRSTTGIVESVTRNPYYRGPGSEDIPGADNAAARIRVAAEGTLVIEDLKAVEVSGFADPGPGGRTLTVQTVDQFGNPHVVKAGNYSNPRWLEWGPSYSPVPGDSGSGVFVVRIKPDGSTGPVLVGVVVDRSGSGGGASILHRKDRWVDAAIKMAEPHR